MENNTLRVKPLSPMKGRLVNGVKPEVVIVNGFPRLDINADFRRFKAWLYTVKRYMQDNGKIIIDVLNPEELG